MPPPALPPGGLRPPAPVSGEQPPTQVVHGGTGPPKCPVPSWASEPPSGSRLLVYKDGLVIQEIAMAKASTLVKGWGHGKGVIKWQCSLVQPATCISQHTTVVTLMWLLCT